mmetsp:Transcript_24828/g.51205  ORF Transcript_24828/g.51205 Transcript_24828/m.51205 type:complete len:213 (-) Transcript_24828:321-959(-)
MTTKILKMTPLSISMMMRSSKMMMEATMEARTMTKVTTTMALIMAESMLTLTTTEMEMSPSTSSSTAVPVGAKLILPWPHWMMTTRKTPQHPLLLLLMTITVMMSYQLCTPLMSPKEMIMLLHPLFPSQLNMLAMTRSFIWMTMQLPQPLFQPLPSTVRIQLLLLPQMMDTKLPNPIMVATLMRMITRLPPTTTNTSSTMTPKQRIIGFVVV